MNHLAPMHDRFDLESLWRVLARDDDLTPEQTETGIPDWIGVRWPDGTFPVAPSALAPLPRWPVDGDGLRAGPSEWAGLALAAHLASQSATAPTCVELGAAVAPWCAAWIYAITRLGAHGRRARALAYEAADGSNVVRTFWAAQELGDFEMAADHNRVEVTGAEWEFVWTRCAVGGSEGSEVYFPKVDLGSDIGARIEETPGSTDYRGFDVEYEPVRAMPLAVVQRDAGHIDFLHIDLQGLEADMALTAEFQDLIRATCVVVVGTHSRDAEARLFEVMPTCGHVLLGDHACSLAPRIGGAVLIQDGEQLWVRHDALTQAKRLGLVSKEFAEPHH